MNMMLSLLLIETFALLGCLLLTQRLADGFRPLHTTRYQATSTSLSSDMDNGEPDPGNKLDASAKAPKPQRRSILRDSSGVPIERVVAGVNVKGPRLPPPKREGKIISGRSGTTGRILNQGKARVQELQNPNRLRIIAGTAKGKKLSSPEVYLRPMMAKVREALFNTLGYLGIFDSNTTAVLDIFAGSGSVGLEALSRGAARTVFVDMSADCCRTALKNADACGFANQAEAVTARAEELLRDPKRFGLNHPFQLVSLTPPYEEVVYKELIDALCTSPLVEENTIVVLEYPVELGSLPYILGGDKLFGIRNRKYGRTVLGIYVYRPTQQFDMRPDEFSFAA